MDENKEQKPLESFTEIPRPSQPQWDFQATRRHEAEMEFEADKKRAEESKSTADKQTTPIIPIDKTSSKQDKAA